MVQWRLDITGSLGPRDFYLYQMFCYVNGQEATQKRKICLQIGTGEVGLLCQVFVIHVLDLFISRFHCITVHLFAVYQYCLSGCCPFFFLSWRVHALNLRPEISGECL